MPDLTLKLTFEDEARRYAFYCLLIDVLETTVEAAGRLTYTPVDATWEWDEETKAVVAAEEAKYA